MRKYLKFILSIIVLGVILQPLLTFDEVDINAFEPMIDYEDISSQEGKNEIESIQEVQIISLYKQKIRSEVIEIIWNHNSNLDIEDIHVNVFEDIDKKNFGEIHSIDIKLIGELDEYSRDTVLQEISDLLNIRKTRISLKVHEG